MTKSAFQRIRQWLAGLSFRTGVIVLACCIPFYVLSFAQLAIPFFSVETKGVLWFVLFGLAKTFHYGGLTILGVEGYKRLKDKFRKSEEKPVFSKSERVEDNNQTVCEPEETWLE